MDTNDLVSAVIIPSLEPDSRLEPYVKSLLEMGFQAVVVDDGSSGGYRPVFDAIAQLPGCTVLRHDVNQGKGCALKTAYRFLMTQRPDVGFIITADADGQHTREDVKKLEEALQSGMSGLILGTRDFSLKHVPSKSRMGNRITSFVFWLLYGVWCPDTQTGLRAFHANLLPLMEQVSGDRFEYEMNVLIALARQKIPMPAVSIQTVYENENVGSHFHPVRDSARIYKVIFGNFFKFISTSLIGSGIDIAIYNVLFNVLENALWEPAWIRIAVAKTIARVISAAANFLMNKNFVFQLKTGGSRAGLKYAALSVVILASSVGLVSLLEYGLKIDGRFLLKIDERISSPVVDLFLFFLSYRVQRGWVFKEGNDEK